MRIAMSVALGLALSSGPSPKVTLLVENVRTIHGDVLVQARPYVAPALQFIENGGTIPRPNEVLVCAQRDKQKTFDEHTDTFVALTCDGGEELTLEGVDLK